MTGQRVPSNSIAMTAAVWPDPQTCIQSVHWGVGSDLFAALLTQLEHEQPIEDWVKQQVEHPIERSSSDGAAEWLLCTQTTDAPVELYWHDGLLHGRISLPSSRREGGRQPISRNCWRLTQSG
jgi:hypothetical protein